MISSSSALSSNIGVKREELLSYDSDSATMKRYYKQVLGVKSTNIWLFGPPGVGKSKLVNSIFKSLHGSFEIETAAVSGSKNAHITKDLKYIPLSTLGRSGGRPGNIFLVDAWGNDDTNYNEALFESILKGKVANNAQMNEKSSKKISDVEDKNKQVHAIVFVITAASCSEKADCASLMKYYQQAVENHLYPIVVVTKVDNVSEDLKQHPERMDNDEEVTNAIGALCSNTGIEIDSVYPVRNLSVDIQKERNDFIVLRCLEILDAALLAADRFFEYQCVFEGRLNKIQESALPTVANKVIRLNAKYLGH
ncbi:hypothetical protein C9374_011854 [Naegleria lovaniensis]|uniref:G domain-containing protein n=1 Tax=Naegleria lovaniensis TaxID=51637 RepID=A0AA88GE43_NAELO|nr:uncharacterized protein C9374_011854 [Naegleria lovaniensis]KAG2373765.1 hypothetical protein C9374_011854 [Naegleria lovaniensis]